MKARFAGFCPVCRREYPAGTEITRGARGWVCCASGARPAAPEPTGSPAAPRPAAPSFRAAVAGDSLAVVTAWEWPAREAVTSAIKSLSTRRWDAASKRWLVPLDAAGRLAALVERAAPALAAAIRALPEVTAAAQAHEAALAASRAAAPLDIAAAATVPVPEGLAYLPFQIAGILYAIERRATLVGDEMGLGKTVQALGVANATGARSILVVCPASLRINWAREAARWLVGAQGDSPALTIAIADGKALPDASVVVVNYERVAKLRSQIDARAWDLLVLDEAHYLKNPKAARTKAVLGYWDARTKADVAGIQAARTVVLTGTPIPNRPIELWPLLSRVLDRDGLGRSWKRYTARHCGYTQTRYGVDVSGCTNPEELQTALRATCMVRRRKADVLRELPAKRRQIVVLPPNGAAGSVRAEQERLAKIEAERIRLQVEAELAKAADDDAAYAAAVAALASAGRIAFEEMARARHETALAKVPAVVEHVADALEGGGVEKVVVFCHHKDVLALLAEGLREHGVVTLSGDDPMDRRQAAVDAFQTDPAVRVFVGTIAAAGVGLTLTAASTVIFAELAWVPAALSQAEDRCHRIGQHAPVLVQHLVLDGTIDAKLAGTIVEKQRNIDAALDAAPDREAEAERLAEAAGDLGEIADAAFERARSREAAVEEAAATKTATRAGLAVEATTISDDARAAIHEGLRLLAGACDGARRRDGEGFNRLDAAIGASLAAEPSLTPRQAALGRRLLTRYRKTQLPTALVARVWGSKEVAS